MMRCFVCQNCRGLPILLQACAASWRRQEHLAGRPRAWLLAQRLNPQHVQCCRCGQRLHLRPWRTTQAGPRACTCGKLPALRNCSSSTFDRDVNHKQPQRRPAELLKVVLCWARPRFLLRAVLLNTARPMHIGACYMPPTRIQSFTSTLLASEQTPPAPLAPRLWSESPPSA